MDTFVKDLKTTPVVIWSIHENQIEYVNSNKKGKKILLNNNDEITINDLKLSKKKIIKIKKCMNKPGDFTKKYKNFFDGYILKIIKKDEQIYMLLQKATINTDNINIPIAIANIDDKIQYISMNQSYKKIKKKSLNDKILECVLKGIFQYENINLYKIE